ncbi:hypothetical protein [Mastigocoleus testarum]|uniref:DUF3598 domain-containing protein n=1 Tax=Mastigocoleus testarum BC008 TaxID=371196 RepID=A0A0V8A0Q8_9CYAN|nr:hypothetical protein [Mastigocoleus testarum]KST70364.1 hypothetical protein BC008_45020 [Mastigocoleus testarum BC008]
MKESSNNLYIPEQTTKKSLETFKVLPHFVGRWEGNWVCMDADAIEIKRFTAILNQNIVDNQWVQTNENFFADGKTETLHFFGKPISDDIVFLESPDIPYCNFKMLIQELSDNIILLRVWDKLTGAPLATETIHLISLNHRVRTIQQFNPPDGNLRGFMIINEKRTNDI